VFACLDEVGVDRSLGKSRDRVLALHDPGQRSAYPRPKVDGAVAEDVASLVARASQKLHVLKAERAQQVGAQFLEGGRGQVPPIVDVQVNPPRGVLHVLGSALPGLVGRCGKGPEEADAGPREPGR
jgi:hypothetical protein